MKKSLIGQSEVLAICGTALLINGFSGWGAALITLGVLGGIVRFAVNFQLIHEEREMQKQGLENSYEKAVTAI